jgi:hypothetical protein
MQKWVTERTFAWITQCRRLGNEMKRKVFWIAKRKVNSIFVLPAVMVAESVG